MRDRNSFCIFLITLFSLSGILQGCNTGKRLNSLVYFNDNSDSALSKTIQNNESAIQPGDRLSIIVNALDPLSAAPYNLGSAVSVSASTGPSQTTASNTGNIGYIVEADGTIHFPQLGNIHVAGMQRKQLVDTLTQRLVKFVSDPIVTIQFLNFKIIVLGEVNKPGTLNVPEGKVTVVEAIGLAGDMPVTARRDNIMIIREKNGQREFGHVNLLSKNIFISPYYNLKQNDVVYVELTKEKVAATDQTQARIRSNISLVTTALSVISTIVVLVITLKK